LSYGHQPKGRHNRFFAPPSQVFRQNETGRFKPLQVGLASSRAANQLT